MQQVWTSQGDHLGIDYPIFGFAHDIATVALIANAGGYSVYGATRRFPDEIREGLALIRPLVAEKPFGVALVLPPRMPEHNSSRSIDADISEKHRKLRSGINRKVLGPPSLRAGYANPL
jgi:hypothetical protein